MLVLPASLVSRPRSKQQPDEPPNVISSSNNPAATGSSTAPRPPITVIAASCRELAVGIFAASALTAAGKGVGVRCWNQLLRRRIRTRCHRRRLGRLLSSAKQLRRLFVVLTY